MNIVMMYYDPDPKASLKAKIERAAVYYQEKYGKAANLCFVHPTMLRGEQAAVEGMEIRSSRSVLPNHFWVGVNETVSQS